MKKHLLLCAVAIFSFGAGVGSNTWAADYTVPNYSKNFYVGAQLGAVSIDYKGTNYQLPTNSSKDPSWGGRFYFGYYFTDLISSELGYDYYGKTEFKHIPTGNEQDLLHQGVDLVGKLNIPFDYGFGGYLKAGGLWIHRDSLESRGGFFADKSANSKLTLLGGAGINYRFCDAWSADVFWTGSLSNGNLPHMYFYGVGLTYKFNNKTASDLY